MAKTYRPYLPEQDLLLPPSLRDWLPEAMTDTQLGHGMTDIPITRTGS
jgi:hypothetical protein